MIWDSLPLCLPSYSCPYSTDPRHIVMQQFMQNCSSSPSQIIRRIGDPVPYITISSGRQQSQTMSQMWCMVAFSFYIIKLPSITGIQLSDVLTNTIYKLCTNYGEQIYYVKTEENKRLCNICLIYLLIRSRIHFGCHRGATPPSIKKHNFSVTWESRIPCVHSGFKCFYSHLKCPLLTIFGWYPPWPNTLWRLLLSLRHCTNK